jgi:DNA-binding MarR family transcriptional regulator
MSVNYVLAFLRVAVEEGLSANDYTRKSGVAQSVMSRHLLDLGQQDRYRERSPGLVESKPSPASLRVWEVTLTAKGRILASTIARILWRES